MESTSILTPSTGYETPPADENSTPVQDSDAAYLATLDRLTNLIIVIVSGGALAGVGGLGLILRTLLKLAATLAPLTPSTEDDKFIQRVIDKIEGRS